MAREDKPLWEQFTDGVSGVASSAWEHAKSLRSPMGGGWSAQKGRRSALESFVGSGLGDEPVPKAKHWSRSVPGRKRLEFTDGPPEQKKVGGPGFPGPWSGLSSLDDVRTQLAAAPGYDPAAVFEEPVSPAGWGTYEQMRKGPAPEVTPAGWGSVEQMRKGSGPSMQEAYRPSFLPEEHEKLEAAHREGRVVVPEWQKTPIQEGQGRSWSPDPARWRRERERKVAEASAAWRETQEGLRRMAAESGNPYAVAAAMPAAQGIVGDLAAGAAKGVAKLPYYMKEIEEQAPLPAGLQVIPGAGLIAWLAQQAVERGVLNRMPSEMVGLPADVEGFVTTAAQDPELLAEPGEIWEPLEKVRGVNIREPQYGSPALDGRVDSRWETTLAPLLEALVDLPPHLKQPELGGDYDSIRNLLASGDEEKRELALKEAERRLAKAPHQYGPFKKPDVPLSDSPATDEWFEVGLGRIPEELIGLVTFPLHAARLLAEQGRKPFSADVRGEVGAAGNLLAEAGRYTAEPFIDTKAAWERGPVNMLLAYFMGTSLVRKLGADLPLTRKSMNIAKADHTAALNLSADLKQRLATNEAQIASGLKRLEKFPDPEARAATDLHVSNLKKARTTLERELAVAKVKVNSIPVDAAGHKALSRGTAGEIDAALTRLHGQRRRLAADVALVDSLADDAGKAGRTVDEQASKLSVDLVDRVKALDESIETINHLGGAATGARAVAAGLMASVAGFTPALPQMLGLLTRLARRRWQHKEGEAFKRWLALPATERVAELLELGRRAQGEVSLFEQNLSDAIRAIPRKERPFIRDFMRMEDPELAQMVELVRTEPTPGETIMRYQIKPSELKRLEGDPTKTNELVSLKAKVDGANFYGGDIVQLRERLVSEAFDLGLVADLGELRRHYFPDLWLSRPTGGVKEFSLRRHFTSGKKFRAALDELDMTEKQFDALSSTPEGSNLLRRKLGMTAEERYGFGVSEDLERSLRSGLVQLKNEVEMRKLYNRVAEDALSAEIVNGKLVTKSGRSPLALTKEQYAHLDEQAQKSFLLVGGERWKPGALYRKEVTEIFEAVRKEKTEAAGKGRIELRQAKRDYDEELMREREIERAGGRQAELRGEIDEVYVEKEALLVALEMEFAAGAKKALPKIENTIKENQATIDRAIKARAAAKKKKNKKAVAEAEQIIKNREAANEKLIKKRIGLESPSRVAGDGAMDALRAAQKDMGRPMAAADLLAVPDWLDTPMTRIRSKAKDKAIAKKHARIKQLDKEIAKAKADIQRLDNPKNRIVRANTAVQKALEKNAPPPKKYGDLDGMYLNEDLFYEFSQAEKVKKAMQNAFGWINRKWKVGKTAWSPKTTMRNLWSNVFLFAPMAKLPDGSTMSVLNPKRLPAYSGAVEDLISYKTSKWYKEARADGVFHSTVSRAEFAAPGALEPLRGGFRNTTAVLEMYGRGVGEIVMGTGKGRLRRAMRNFSGGTKAVTELPGMLYGALDDVFRLAYYREFRTQLELMGVSSKAARKRATAAARKQFIDYENVAGWVQYLRTPIGGAGGVVYTFIGQPFIAFPSRAIPLMLDWMKSDPIRAQFYMNIHEQMTYASQDEAGRRHNIPNLSAIIKAQRRAIGPFDMTRIAPMGFLGPDYVLSGVDEDGRPLIQYINASYLTPISQYTLSHDPSLGPLTNFMNAAKQIQIGQNPYTTAALSLLEGLNWFTGKPAYSEKEGPSQFGKAAQLFTEQMFPPAVGELAAEHLQLGAMDSSSLLSRIPAKMKGSIYRHEKTAEQKAAEIFGVGTKSTPAGENVEDQFRRAVSGFDDLKREALKPETEKGRTRDINKNRATAFAIDRLLPGIESAIRSLKGPAGIYLHKKAPTIAKALEMEIKAYRKIKRPTEQELTFPANRLAKGRQFLGEQNQTWEVLDVRRLELADGPTEVIASLRDIRTGDKEEQTFGLGDRLMDMSGGANTPMYRYYAKKAKLGNLIKAHIDGLLLGPAKKRRTAPKKKKAKRALEPEPTE